MRSQFKYLVMKTNSKKNLDLIRKKKMGEVKIVTIQRLDNKMKKFQS